MLGNSSTSSSPTAFSSTPTETSPMIWPFASRRGTFARIERPSDPVWTATWVWPASTAVTGSPGSWSSDLPISAGSGWE